MAKKKYQSGGTPIPSERSGVLDYRKKSGTKKGEPVKVKFKSGGSKKK